MESSIQVLLDKMLVMYQNIININKGFQEATVTNSADVTVSVRDPETGVVSTVTVNSFQRILHEMSRQNENYKSLISADNLSYTLEADGSISQQVKTSFINAEYLESFAFGNGVNCDVENSSDIDDLVFPRVTIPVTIDSQLVSDVVCKSLVVTYGWDAIKDGVTLVEMEYLRDNGIIAYKEIDRVLELKKTQVQYFGKFITTATSQSTNNENLFTATLNTTLYSGLYSLATSFDLKVGDMLVSGGGATKYQIQSIDKFSKVCTLLRIAGIETLQVGTDTLYFNEQLATTDNVVGIPVRPQTQMVVFLSTQNIKAKSFPSNGLKIDTSTYKVTYKNTQYSLDEFFATYVTNFSDYLMALINETSIPSSLGVKPQTPTLLQSNFKVIQINKHLTDAKTLTEIGDMNKRKQALQNEIDYNQAYINKTQTELDTLKYATNEEKTEKQNQIKIANEKNASLKTNLLNIARDIDTSAIKNGLKTATPKYRVIGFWDIQTPIYSPLTKAQHIIKYEVQYRYLAKDIDTIESTSYKMIDNNGKNVTVVFSPWSDYPTKTRNKVLGIDGVTLEWETQVLDSVDDININQLAISINEGESIEVKIRAVSEAGFPISPIKSDWSEIIRIDFPLEMRANNVSTTISQNAVDLNKAEFDNILNSYGLLKHVAGSIREGEKTYLHNASEIASGQFTTEQKNIPLDTFLVDILKRMSVLEKTDATNNVTVQLVDFNSEVYTVKNNTTMELFAGNYVENNSLLDKTKWGSIIRKTGYIKIKNNNAVPIEIKTFVPGTEFSSTTAADYYNVPVYGNGKYGQESRQIIYFRNKDVSGNENGDIFKLVVDKKTLPKYAPENAYLVGSNPDKKIKYINNEGTTISEGTLTDVYDSSFVAFAADHPYYGDDTKMLAEFQRIMLYTSNLKQKQSQNAYAEGDTQALVGFQDTDFYAVGLTTTGAFLYPLLQNVSKLQVIGNSTTSTLILPKESELSIPFVFEYRMIDRLGNIDGNTNTSVNDTLEYSKKIGIDIFLNNEKFKFDINVTSRLKSKISVIDSLNIGSVTGAFNNEEMQSLG